ncbi:MAG: response regulator [Candidatus Hydrothermarchaeaceae archaeon]
MTKIMVIDEDPDVILVLERILKKFGCEVVGLTDSRNCLSRVKEEMPDLIFLDVMMPDKDGWEVCREIKDNPSTSSIPISMLTVMKDEEHIKKSFNAGADQHLGKPINFKDIYTSIENLLGTGKPTTG